MTLLDEIIDGARGDAVPVAALLRNVKVLAARMGTVQLEEWVEHELVGYPADGRLPSYRGPFHTEVVGHFGGPFGSGIQNAPVPAIGFPAEFRDGSLFNIEFRQPIAELQQLAQSEKRLEANWPADAVAYTNTLMERGEVQLYEHMGLQQAWQVISPVQLRGIVDTVRTRVLDLALSLEKLEPHAGERDGAIPDRAAVQQIVNNNIYGGAANIAVSSSDFDQSITLPPPGDTPALFRYLEEIGFVDSDLDDLRSAMGDDDASGEAVQGEKVGSRVEAWLGRMAVKASVAAGTGAATAAGGLAAKALAAHYGIHL